MRSTDGGGAKGARAVVRLNDGGDKAKGEKGGVMHFKR